MESPTLARVKKTREAFDEKDSAASQIAHDATLKDWEEDGHNSGAHAEACYRRVDAAQVGLCAAIALESALGGDVSRPRLLSLALTLALAVTLTLAGASRRRIRTGSCPPRAPSSPAGWPARSRRS